MKYSPIPQLTVLLMLASIGWLHAQNIIADPFFDSGITNWIITIPDESKHKNCQFEITSDSPHSHTNCARLTTDDFARFSIIPKMDLRPAPGDHYHVIVWVKADPSAEVQPDSPGIVVRMSLLKDGKGTTGGDFYIGLDNVMNRGVKPPPAITKLPTEWTKIEGDFVMPHDADRFFPSLFAWYTKGSIYFDDISIEKTN